MNLYLILLYHSCTATTLSCNFQNIELESSNGSHLESLDALGPGRRILNRMCTHSLTTKQWQNIVAYFLQISTNISSNLCNNSDQTLFSDTLKFARSVGLGFQHPPRDLANFNAWKTMFDPYIKTGPKDSLPSCFIYGMSSHKQWRSESATSSAFASFLGLYSLSSSHFVFWTHLFNGSTSCVVPSSYFFLLWNYKTYKSIVVTVVLLPMTVPFFFLVGGVAGLKAETVCGRVAHPVYNSPIWSDWHGPCD